METAMWIVDNKLETTIIGLCRVFEAVVVLPEKIPVREN